MGMVASIRACQRAGVMPVIAEIKVRSPKEGDLLGGRDPQHLARAYTAAGAAGISVVTEVHDFGGSLDIIRQIRTVTDLPILRKDFPRSTIDIDETVSAGAQVLLLTVKMLDPDGFADLHDAALSAGLETLVEVSSEDEITRLRQMGITPSIVGINNRNIAIGETDDGDVGHTERLAAALAGTAPVLSESAISGTDDARRARAAGADAVLVGTAILRADDPGEMVESLTAVGWPQ